MVISAGQMKVASAATKNGQVCQTWYVSSETNPDLDYIVHHRRNTVSHRKVWTCNCLDFTERRIVTTGATCKHIRAVMDSVLAQQFLGMQTAVPVEVKPEVKPVSVRLKCGLAYCSNKEFKEGDSPKKFFAKHLPVNTVGVIDLNTDKTYTSFSAWQADQQPVPVAAPVVEPVAEPAPSVAQAAISGFSGGYVQEPRLRCEYCVGNGLRSPVYPSSQYPTIESYFAQHWGSNMTDLKTGQIIKTQEEFEKILELEKLQTPKTVEAAEPAVPEPAAVPEPSNAVPLDTRRILALVVAHLNGDNGSELWDILSALRGPDSVNQRSLKYATTAAIRHVIGMTGKINQNGGLYNNLTINYIQPIGWNSPSSYEIVRDVCRSFSGTSDHFASHYARAVLALKKIGLV